MYLHKFTTTVSGEYPANTKFITFWNGSTITVSINGEQITSGPDLGIEGKDYYTHTYGSQFCDGTTLVKFSYNSVNPSFPYSFRETEENSTECQTDPVVCDVVIDSIEVEDSSVGMDNGKITINATSANTLHYAIGKETRWPSGQHSNEITSLSPGVYTVSAFDEYNCVAFRSNIEIGEKEISDIRFRAEWKDSQGFLSKFEISEKGYNDVVEEINTGPTPFTCHKPSQDISDIFIPIHPTQAQLNASSDTNFKYRDLYTQDDRKYLGTWYKDTGSGYSVMWKGYLRASVFSEPYIHTPYPTSLTFIDGLETLKNTSFVDASGNSISGSKSIIKIVSLILNKLELSIGIKCGVNVYDSGMNTTDDDDPLAQSYYDTAIFYDKNEPWDCHKVLTEILKPFGARIKQWEGYWWITRIQEEHTAFDYREFDLNGNYVTFGTYSPGVNISGASNVNRAVMINRDAMLEMVPGYGEVKITNHLNEIGNLISNGGFNNYVEIGSQRKFSDWSLNITNSEGGNWIQEKIKDNNTCTLSWVGGNEGNIFIASKVLPFSYAVGDQLRVSIKVGVDKIDNSIPWGILRYFIRIAGESTNGRYLNKFGEFSAGGGTYWLNREKITFNESLTEFSRVITLPALPDIPNGDDEDDTTIQIGVYCYSVLDTDFGDYYTESAATMPDPDDNPDLYRPGELYTEYQPGSGKIWFYEVVDNTVTTTDWDFEAIKSVIADNIISNTKFFIDDVDIDILPAGLEPPSTETITILNSNNYKEKLDIDLILADLPDTFISNARNIYNDYMRLSDGTPTGTWTRDGVTESDTIQKVLLKQYNKQYNTPSQKITATLTTKHQNSAGGISLGFNNSFLETHDNKVYYLNAMEIDDKNSSYSVELIQLKEESGGSDGGGSSGFSGAFTSGFGSGFEVIYK